MKEEKNVVENKEIKRSIIVIPIIAVIIIVASFIFYKTYIDKSYEIEEITQFSYFKLYENEKYGVIDSNGNILVEAKYDMLTIPNPSKAVFIGYFNYDSQEGQYDTEVVNEKNEKILTEYEEVLPIMLKDISTDVPYEKSVLAYKENGKYGIINFEGKRITKAIYDSIESLLYKEGCLIVKQDEKYGIINIKGKEIIEPKYDSITADGYYDETTKFKKAGFIVGTRTNEGYRYGYIDTNGKSILDTEYNEIARITEIIDNDEIYILAFKNGQAGVYINKKQLIDHEYEEIEYNKINELYIVQKKSKQGVINQNGDKILNTEYDYIMISNETITTEKEGILYNFDIEGNKKETENNRIVVDKQNTNYFIVMNEEDKFGIIDKDGNTIFENEYSYIEYAFKDYFIITKNAQVSVVDAATRQKVISEYNVIQKLEGKNILQAIITESYTIELYNEKMEKIASMQESNLSIEQQFIKLSSKTDRKYFDFAGKEINYNEIFTNLSLYAYKNEDGKWGFKDKEGNVKVEANYDMVTELNTYGFAGIRKDNRWGVINSEGKIIVEPIYEIEYEEPEFIGPYCKLNFGYGMVYYTKDLEEE